MLGYYIVLVGLGLSVGVIGPTIPALAQNVNSDLSGISLVFTIHSLGYLVGCLQTGKWIDRLPGHPFVSSLVGVMVITLAAIPLIKSLWLLLLGMFVMGVAEAGADLGPNNYLMWIYRHRVAPYLNGLHFSFSAGAFLAPILATQIAMAGGGIRWIYWVMALLLLPGIPWLLKLPSPSPAVTIRSSTRAGENNLFLAVMVVFLALYVGGEVGVSGWIYTYTVSSNLSDAAMAAYLTSAFWGMLTLGRLLGVPLAKRFDPKTLLTVDLFCCIGGALILLVWRQSIFAIWLATLVLGLSMASIFPMSIAYVGRYVKITGKTTSMFFVGASLGGMSVPWIIGQLIVRIGPIAVVYVIMAVMVLAAAVFGLMNILNYRSST